MYSMKEVAEAAGMSYETLKFYCNQGLVPNVKRNKSNHRVFSEHDLAWVKSLSCLKNCEMSIAEMKEYLALCLQGQGTIPERMAMLAKKEEELHEKAAALQEALDYIAWKKGYYDEVTQGKRPYTSVLVPEK